jgi:hypothetical protein
MLTVQILMDRIIVPVTKDTKEMDSTVVTSMNVLIKHTNVMKMQFAITHKLHTIAHAIWDTRGMDSTAQISTNAH